MDSKELFEITKYHSIPIICGPTASGKTSLSIKLAKELSGEICCCDSMQIYRHLSVGTAKPTEEEKAQVPHHLIDLLDPDETFNVASYVEEAYKKIDELLSKNILPVFCGGTGLYVQALQKGFAFEESPIDPVVEEKIQSEYEKNGIEPLYTRLIELDPECREKIHINNTKRVLHVLALLESLHTTTKEIKTTSVKEGPRYPFTLFCIDWPRDILYSRINQRVDMMMDDGIVEEAKWLYDQNLPESLTAMQAIGYKEFFPYFRSEKSLSECVELLKQHTRNYAKRQLTWFRHMDDVHWLSGEKLMEYDLKVYL